MVNRALTSVFLLLLLFAATGCVYALEETNDGGEGSMSLALSLKTIGSREVSTKMSQEITQTQTGDNFRGIEEIIVVPYRTSSGDSVRYGDQRIGIVELQNPGIQNTFASTANAGLVYYNNSHYYRIAFVPTGTNRVLAYGKAIDKGYVTNKAGLHRNGTLEATVLDKPVSAEGIAFNLKPILGTMQDNGNEVREIDVIYETADALIDALNVVVDALRGSSEPLIRSILDEIKRDNQILACSYLTFDTIVREVVSKMQQSGKNDNVVLTAITQLNTLMTGVGAFPSSYGIPEGALGFWWNGDRFLRLISDINIAIVDPGSYCYPPNLWYFTNSPVRTANKDENLVDQYAATNPSWNDNILDQYYISGTSVSSTSRSVAIENQLQYGVALLELSLGECSVTEAYGCPLTGVIVGDQKDVDFNFNPKSTSASRYVFDNVVSGLSLGAASTATVETLVLQTRDRVNQNKVHFALEFKNTTQETLHCQQGDIFPNARFYFVGELDPRADDVTQPSGETLYSVFVKDHKTHITAKINSLGNAYNTVPDLHEPQLEIGIVAEMKWDQITPQSVKLNM